MEKEIHIQEGIFQLQHPIFERIICISLKQRTPSLLPTPETLQSRNQSSREHPLHFFPFPQSETCNLFNYSIGTDPVCQTIVFLTNPKAENFKRRNTTPPTRHREDPIHNRIELKNMLTRGKEKKKREKRRLSPILPSRVWNPWMSHPAKRWMTLSIMKSSQFQHSPTKQQLQKQTHLRFHLVMIIRPPSTS